MEKMEIYEAGKTVPQEAQKSIAAGRLKGFTDINPMWRIRKLTELFGPCGVGWYYTIEKEWLEPSATGEVAAFVLIHLFIKADGEWSKPITGVGGSTFVANEKSGPRMSDEAYKMAQTDALSVACKNLGIGAAIYWKAGETKYNIRWDQQEAPESRPSLNAQIASIGEGNSSEQAYVCADCGKPFQPFTDSNDRTYSAADVWSMAKARSADGIARCKSCRIKKDGHA